MIMGEEAAFPIGICFCARTWSVRPKTNASDLERMLSLPRISIKRPLRGTWGLRGVPHPPRTDNKATKPGWDPTPLLNSPAIHTPRSPRPPSGRLRQERLSLDEREGRTMYFPTRSASSFVRTLTRLWTLKPLCHRERIRSAHCGLESSRRTRKARTSRENTSASRESSQRPTRWKVPAWSTPPSVTRRWR